jgi:CubicO group peptidase (beta-lactamase class C family)
MRTKLLLSLWIWVSAAVAQADPALQDFLSASVEATREKAQLPAIAALVQIDGKVAARAAVGVRDIGAARPIGADDRWHLGSDTKAMTATLIARLAESGVLRFDETLAQVFPGIAARMNPALTQVTVKQLLSHTSGLAPLGSDREMTEFLSVLSRHKGIRAQRAAIVIHYLTRPPASKAGEFAYSNLGYIIAGAAAEARTGDTWEELIEREVWKPLGIRHAGFGSPGKPGSVDQPRGHEWSSGKWVSVAQGAKDSDNPAAVGPAGTVSMSLGDWLLFAQDQLDGPKGRGKLLKPETYQLLQTPVTKNYALGWGVFRGEDGATAMLSHMGSNGHWVSDVRIYPRRGYVVMSVMNAGGERAENAARELGKILQEKLDPFESGGK